MEAMECHGGYCGGCREAEAERDELRSKLLLKDAELNDAHATRLAAGAPCPSSCSWWWTCLLEVL